MPSLPPRAHLLSTAVLVALTAVVTALLTRSCHTAPSPVTSPEAVTPTPDPLDVGPLPPTTLPAIPIATSFPPSAPGTENKRFGDEIVIAGRYFRTGTRVVLWTDPGGYDAYRTERRFSPWADAAYAPPTPRPTGTRQGQDAAPESPARFGLRTGVLNWSELELVRGGGWPLELLRQKVDQFVIHYDVVGASRVTFKTLHDERGLSVHFMLDADGTIYQTLDVKERALHATTSNMRSVGIEIANRGAYASDVPLREFYALDPLGPRITFPPRFGDNPLLVPPPPPPSILPDPLALPTSRPTTRLAPLAPLAPGYRPIRPQLVRGRVNGANLVMYDFTPEQYAALARLTATLCTVLPRITLDYPKDARGRAIMEKLPPARLERYQGLIGHYNIQSEKYDPGPAFQWELLVSNARGLMSAEAMEANRKASRSPVRAGPIQGVPSGRQEGR